MAGGWPIRGVGFAALLWLAACVPGPQGPVTHGVKPQARPDNLQTTGAPTPQRSGESRALAQYYARVEQDLLDQGLLRTDAGNGPDTPFDAATLARNFEYIALQDEYVRGRGLERSGGTLGPVKKWQRPIRVAAEFGATVPASQREKDRTSLARYVQRLSALTGHSMSMVDSDPNFVVMFVGEDDKAIIKPRILSLVPNLNTASLRIFDTLPRSIHCLVVAFSSQPGGYSYGQAVAVIRAEHPDLMRLSCIHEEVAQGLGLGNDSPRARPSIFNDDDEFALLTGHDELLLKILYNSRLTPGMSAETARPIVREIAASLMGGPS
ncbi:DUF2927 domain-containing protein [Pseudoprimorskyibacter insulae]|uniref:DUF2927 domain-containing protein n=1 Tax=Pseudoprimorskyibacter insulae TaxID=1695997 RepID=A0A2R8AVF8_9RHOB|nr:DUF2927 domain-containing protein [Pseudoprimorskyibacter insulae]SPF79917.1 hypothetical protein PRI8871_01719 [Pseudoprimorskyibacter insulae]